MSIDQIKAEALALPLRDRVELLIKVQDSLPDEQKLGFDPEYLREIAQRADEPKSGKKVVENA